ncbi:MAG: hypothetical protein ACREIQ_01880 [Nitrospiria bacterium]
MKILLILAFFVLGMPQRVLSASGEWGPGDLLQIPIAFLTNLAIHESGHFIIAEGADAQDNTLNFFSEKEGSFFLGLSTVSTIDEKSKVTYILGGEIATDLIFEIALDRYRSFASGGSTAYNRSLLFFSGTDFLWYTLYAFYLAPSRDNRYDPVALSEATDLGPETILVIAATQTILNAYRVYSGQDRIIPYFTFDQQSVSFRLGMRF